MDAGNRNKEFEFIQGLTADLSAPLLIFPTSLSATMNIRRAILHDDISNDTLARIIGTEPVLSAQILKLANSVAFNPIGRINTELKVATMRLGYVKVRNLTIAVGMKQLTEHKDLNPEISKLMEGLWTRSVRVAAFSYVLAIGLTKVNADDAMLAGLLHDVGKFYILNRANHYQALFTSQRALWNLVDAWHTSIGAAILDNWSISENICSAVQNFGNKDYVHRGGVDLTDVIYAADLLDAHFDPHSHRELDWEALPPLLTRFDMTEVLANELHEQMLLELDGFLSAIR
jgi:HD-like signal output (HDOD) protein